MADLINSEQKLKSELFKKVSEAEKTFITDHNKLKYGQFLQTGLIAGLPYDFDHAIGYVVQVRTSPSNVFGANYLLRHSDGALRTHSNQAFWRVPDELLGDVISLFEPTPEHEGGDTVYSIDGKFPAAGFIVNVGDDEPVCTSASIRVTQEA